MAKAKIPAKHESFPMDISYANILRREVLVAMSLAAAEEIDLNVHREWIYIMLDTVQASLCDPDEPGASINLKG